MANLKELRNKIGVVQSIRKVTEAMKLVAAAKLKKAEQKAEEFREYAFELSNMLAKIARRSPDTNYELFFGRREVSTEMLLVFASDKGLCGNFNYLVSKEVSGVISGARAAGRKLHFVCIGAKLFEFLKRRLREDEVIDFMSDFYKSSELFDNSRKLAEKIIKDFTSGRVDKVSVVGTKYISPMHRVTEVRSVIPAISAPEDDTDRTETVFEPNIADILKEFVPYNIGIRIYQSALESVAGEQGSRMTSMDGATRNADELLTAMTKKYNKTRQYNITQELVEVVAGASAMMKG
ncbi:MAG: ATP synthase F1 subunit gamma [Holosporaceae bacterium]|jgi:F-type H+-transporting ATPase subunit gamma|nr:ATP synthase F1 subunit gamma [Holosporaceae bacterium]